MSDSSKPERVLYAIAAIAVVIGGLKAASGILVPALLALFIAIVCTEPMYFMMDRGVPRGISITVVVLALLGLSSIVPFVITGSFVQFTEELPTYQRRLDKLVEESIRWIADYGYDPDSIRAVLDPSAAFGYVQVVLTALGGILTRTFLILLLVIFILVDAPKIHQSASAAGEVMRTVQHYFAIKTFTSMLTGLFIAGFLMVMEVQYPLLWGFLAFLLNFVPNIGSVLAAVPAVLLAVLFDGFTTAFVVALGYVVINVTVSNALEPRIMGQQLGIKFVWIFVSLIAWGWILGPVGMLLAVPLTMTLRIVFDHHPATIWISDILKPVKQQETEDTAHHDAPKPVQ